MASIKRRRGKYHVVYYYLNEDGEKKQKWESFDTEAEAKHRKAEIEYKQGSRTFIAPSKTTVAAFLEDFVSLYGTKKWSPSTYEANTGLIRNYINPKLGSTLMQDVTSIAADRFISALQRTKCPTYRSRPILRAFHLNILCTFNHHVYFLLFLFWAVPASTQWHNAVGRANHKPGQKFMPELVEN